MGQRDNGTAGQGETQRQRDNGTARQWDSETMGQRDKGTPNSVTNDVTETKVINMATTAGQPETQHVYTFTYYIIYRRTLDMMIYDMCSPRPVVKRQSQGLAR
jgi:hypothetical protein